MRRLFGDQDWNIDRSASKKVFEMLCKRKLIDFDGLKTPEPHIDLWLTPIDDKTLLLGDISQGKKIMEKISQSERSKIVNKFIKAERSEGFRLRNGKRRKNYKKLFYSILFHNNNNSLDGIHMDTVKEYLEKKGFTVIRIPLMGHLDIHPDSYYSYNNVLMESYKGSNGRIIKNVILPQYGMPLDGIARQVWELMGFTVKQFPMNHIARKGGAIRCSSQRIPGSVSYQSGIKGSGDNR